MLAAIAFALALAPGNGSAQIPAIRPEPEVVTVNDPSESFLKAFTAIQQGEKLEADGNLRGALAKYRYGASLLEQLSQASPNWQPLIVRYRARKTADNIQKLDDKLSVQPGGTSAGQVPEPQNPGSGNARSNASVSPGSEEDPLPAAEESTTAAAGRGSASDTAAQQAAQAEYLDHATVELRNKLTKTQRDLKSALDQLSTAKKDKETALKDKGDVEYQLQSLKSEVKIAQKRFERTKSDRDDLQAQIDKREVQLKEALSKNPDAADTRKELRNQLAAMKDALAKAQAEAAAAGKSRDDLTQKLAESDGRNAGLTTERDTAVARSELTKDAADKIEALQSQNTQLTDKLSTAEKSIADLTAESIKKKEELDGVRTELTTLKDQLASTKEANDRSASTIADLRTQLDDKAKLLGDLNARGMTTEDVGKMTKENELLRGIVMRQLKDQARRVAAKQLLTEELARLEVQSATLNHDVEELGRPTLQLSDAERALFKDPQVLISDSAASIAAIRPKTDESAPAVPDGIAPPPATGGNDVPQVETTFRPKVADELMPMAREAKENFDRGKYADAERVYEKLLARDPKNPYLLSNQGVVLFREDKLKSSEIMLKKAVAVAPRDAFSQATLGIVYYRMHRYDDALNALTQAIQLDPKNATAHNYLGITSSQKGWPEAAIDELQKAIALNPNYADAHFNLAVVYATNQPPDLEKAREHYRIAVSLGASADPTLEKLLRK